MDTLKFRLRFFIIVLCSVMACGVAGFMLFEKTSFLDAVYFSIVTVATVGYGDIHPVTAIGKIISIILIIGGTGTFLGVIAGGMEMFLNKREKELRLQKLHMITGLFFSEIGTKLLSYFS